MSVRPIELPRKSALHEVVHPGDFIDCYYNDGVPGEISVLRHEQGFALATWVHIHNRFGRVYLWAIMPFHKLIVRDAVRRISRKIK